MKVLKMKNNEDGSCTLDIEMTDEEEKILLNYAINKILKEQIDEKILLNYAINKILKEQIDEMTDGGCKCQNG